MPTLWLAEYGFGVLLSNMVCEGYNIG